MGFLYIVFCQILCHTLVIRAQEAIIIHVGRFVVTRLAFTVHGIPVGMLVQQFPAVHRPFPIMCLQSGFFAKTINIFIVSLEHDTRNTTFFQQRKPFFPFGIRTVIQTHPQPVFNFTGRYLFCPETSFIIYYITDSFSRIGYSYLIGILSRFHRNPGISRKSLQLFISQKELFCGTQVVMLFTIIILLCVEHGPQQFINSLIVRINQLILRGSHLLVYEIKISPTVGHVHINSSGRSPYPVFLRSFLLQPLHTREVDAPGVAGLQRIIKVHGQRLMRNGHFHTPILIFIF